MPPEGWELVSESVDQQTAVYRTADRSGKLTINSTPRAPSRPGPAEMAKAIGPEMRKYARRMGYELEFVRIERDDRFLLVAHYRMRTDRGVTDEKQMYRELPGSLVYVNVAAFTDNEEAAARIHAVGAAVLDGATSGAGPRRFWIVDVRLFTPADWVLESNEKRPGGSVAVFRAPEPETAWLVIRSQAVPALVPADPRWPQPPHLRDMIDAERREPPLEGLVPTGDLEVLELRKMDPRTIQALVRSREALARPQDLKWPDVRFLEGTRRSFSSSRGPVVSQTRYVCSPAWLTKFADGTRRYRAALLIAVSAVGPEAADQELEEIAARVALSAGAGDPKPPGRIEAIFRVRP